MKVLPAILFFITFSGLAGAQELNPCDQNGINQALQNGGTVYLNAGVYEITGTINIHSNTILTGSPDAIIGVSSSSSQFFTGATGIVSSNGPVNNVLISNIQIDGNCENLPHSYNSNDQDPHDCERGMIFIGYTNQFGNNITVQKTQFQNLVIFHFFISQNCNFLY